mgnify:CR=1 FL=1
MNQNPVSNPIENQAAEAGKLFAVSELDAIRALEIFARAVGTEPVYAEWIAARTDWVNGYVETKPQAKGNSADQAFSRFARRMIENYGIVAPKATSEAATKKAAERAKKAADLEQRFAGYSDHDLTAMLQKAYEDAARNPTKKSSLLGELQRAAAIRAKARATSNRDALKATRARLFKLARECDDPERIEAAADVLDPDNDVTIQ